MSLRSVAAALAALVLTASLAACGASPRAPLVQPTEDAKVIAFFYPQADEYFHLVRTNLEQVAANDGARVIAVNTNSDASIEGIRVDDLLRAGEVDAFVMLPADTGKGSLQTMRTIRAAGVPLICYGSCTGTAASEDVVDGVVQSDNTSLGAITGKQAAAYIKTKLGGKAVVGILNCDQVDVCQLRKAGFKKALADAGVRAVYAADERGFLADPATPVAAAILAAHPETNVFWAANEGGTNAEIRAVRTSKKNVRVFGTDISSDLASALLAPEDVLQATTGQDTFSTAEIAYRMATTAIKGQKNVPFAVVVPGLGYSRDRVDTVKNYLRQ